MKNAPAVDAEGIAYLCSQGRLVAFEMPQEGTPKMVWEYVVGSHVPGPIVVAADGTIRVHSSDGFLHCISPAGKQDWAPAHVGEPLGWAAPVCDEQGNTYISAYDGGLIRVDPQGKMGRRPYFRSRRKFDSAGVISNGLLYVGSEDGYIFAIRLDLTKGTNVFDHAAEQGYTGGYLNSSPAVSEEGVLVVAAGNETLYGFAPSGATVWATKMPGMMLASPVIDPHGHVYVGVAQAQRGREARGQLVCLDGNSHKIRWQYDAAGAVESTPVIGDDDTIYFGDNSGTIHAVNTLGKAKWTTKVEAAVRSAGAMLAPGRLAFGLDDDRLVVVKCDSKGLAAGGWPKIAGTRGQTGTAPAASVETAVEADGDVDASVPQGQTKIKATDTPPDANSKSDDSQKDTLVSGDPPNEAEGRPDSTDNPNSLGAGL